MQIIITQSEDEVAHLGAHHVREVLRKNHRSVLGLATGATPIALYKQLANYYKHGDISFK